MIWHAISRNAPLAKEKLAMSTTLTQQLEEYLAGWMQRVPAERRAAMERHIAHLSQTGADASAKRAGDRAPEIVLPDAHGQTFKVATLLAKGPVIVTVLSRRLVSLLQPGTPGVSGRAGAHRGGGRQPGCDQSRKARRYREHDREKCAHISGAKRCWPEGREGVRPGLLLHRRIAHCVRRHSSSTFRAKTARPTTGRFRSRRPM